MVEAYFRAVAQGYYAFLCVFGVLLFAEIFVARSTMTVRQRSRGLLIWGIMIPFGILIWTFYDAAIDWLGIEPLIDRKISFVSGLLAAFAAGLITDFIFYCFHRVQHRYLWRWHSVHHSIENLSAINSYHHWSEPLWSMAITGLPLSLISVEILNQTAWFAVLIMGWPYYIHSPTRLHLGPFSRLIIDNRFHRIHHSVHPQHYDHNFGALTPLWDVVFGTAYFPAKDEWPNVGLAHKPEPETFRQWLQSASDRPQEPPVMAPDRSPA